MEPTHRVGCHAPAELVLGVEHRTRQGTERAVVAVSDLGVQEPEAPDFFPIVTPNWVGPRCHRPSSFLSRPARGLRAAERNCNAHARRRAVSMPWPSPIAGNGTPTAFAGRRRGSHGRLRGTACRRGPLTSCAAASGLVGARGGLRFLPPLWEPTSSPSMAPRPATR